MFPFKRKTQKCFIGLSLGKILLTSTDPLSLPGQCTFAVEVVLQRSLCYFAAPERFLQFSSTRQTKCPFMAGRSSCWFSGSAKTVSLTILIQLSSITKTFATTLLPLEILYFTILSFLLSCLLLYGLISSGFQAKVSSSSKK